MIYIDPDEMEECSTNIAICPLFFVNFYPHYLGHCVILLYF